MKHRMTMMVIELAMVTLATLFAFELRWNFEMNLEQLVRYFPYIGLTLISALVVIPLFRLDRSYWRFSGMPDYLRITYTMVSIVVLTALMGFIVDRLNTVPRSLPVLQLLVLLTMSIGTRVGFRLMHERRMRENVTPVAPSASQGRDVVLVVGINRLAELYLLSVKDLANESIEVVGIVSTDERHTGRQVQSTDVLGSAVDVGEVVRRLEVHGIFVDSIVVTVAYDQLPVEAREAIEQVENATQIRVTYLTEWLGPSRAQRSDRDRPLVLESPVSRLSDETIAAIGRRRYWLVKRLIDILGAAVLIPVNLPVMMLVAVGVFFDVGSPSLFWQRRDGMGGRSFGVYKFRTMRAAHDSAGRRLSDDERVSAFGAALRRTRLDELPQLFMILTGKMSFIGPRPLLPADQTADARIRRIVRPGLTGWAQVHGGRHVSPEDKMILDAWYVCHASLWLDVQVVLLTFPMILKGETYDEDEILRARRELGVFAG